nr:murein L,D-transpeptidase catalytic domain family protein [Vibrio hippocampi]
MFNRYRNLFFALVSLSAGLVSFSATSGSSATNVSKADKSSAGVFYNNSQLKGKLDFQLFEDAFNAYKTTSGKAKPILTIIDYSKPSTEKRFYVIDMKKGALIYNTYVAHGVNSGQKTATKFSNVVDSKKTSLGTFLTDSTYYGSKGYSLRLDGLSSGKNDNARKRYIVVHGADYADEEFLQKNGYLGRSWGCPALPQAQTREIIDTIKGGSVIYASS